LEKLHQLSPIYAAYEAQIGGVNNLRILAAVDKTRLVVADDSGWQPIHEAVRAGDAVVVKFLLENGADIDARTTYPRGVSPLTLAVDYHGKDHAVVKLLLSYLYTSPIDPMVAAANGMVNELEIQAVVDKASLVAADENGWQPIHMAARAGHINAIDVLLKNGANVNAYAGSLTPLNIARDNFGYGHPVEWFLRNKGGRV
jgi:ankyrin repeat protein